MPSLPPLTAHPLVVQHNALVNARFDLNTTESRLFLGLLARIQREDTSFSKCQLPVREIMDTAASNNYDHVRRMLKTFASRTLTIEELGPDGRPLKLRNFVVIPLLAYAKYGEGSGTIEAQFNDHLRGYLLELRDNFTKAQLTELLKLKSASSYRIYWLLREYAAFGKRTIPVEELKAILGLAEEYDRFNNFRVRVLDRAQEELAETDLPFTYELVKSGRTVTDIKFLFKPLNTAAVQLASPATEWETVLLEVGVSVASLATVQAKLAAGEYDEGYVYFVIARVKEQVKVGKVKKEAGAVFKALTDGYLLPAYQKSQLPTSVKVAPAKSMQTTLKFTKAGLSVDAEHKRLNSELADARDALEFVNTSPLYDQVTRPEAIERNQSKITALEMQLSQLGIGS